MGSEAQPRAANRNIVKAQLYDQAKRRDIRRALTLGKAQLIEVLRRS